MHAVFKAWLKRAFTAFKIGLDIKLAVYAATGYQETTLALLFPLINTNCSIYYCVSMMNKFPIGLELGKFRIVFKDLQ